MAKILNAPVNLGFAIPRQPTHEISPKTLYPETDLEIIPTEKMIRAAAKWLAEDDSAYSYTDSGSAAYRAAEKMLLAAFAAARVIKR